MQDAKEEKTHPEVAPIGLMFDPMEQMRELLFGATERETERQISLLEAKADEMRKEFLARFEATDSLLLEMTRELEKAHSESIMAIGAAIIELGERVQSLSKNRKA